jgi:hypothetical protein
MTLPRWTLRALSLSVVLPLSASAQTASDLDARGFTEAVANLYARAEPDAQVMVKGPLELEIRAPKGVRRAALAMLFSRCQGDRSDCAADAEREARATVESAGAPASAPTLAQLRVTVRPSTYVDQLGAEAGDPVAEPLVDDLWIVGVKDQPSTIAALDAKDLAALKLDATGALKAGEHNLEARFRATLEEAARREPASVGEMRGDDYLASLLAFPDLWAPLAETFDGALYVAAPAANTVLFVDAREKDAMAQMRRAVRAEMSLAQRPVSAAVLAWSPAGWDVAAKAGDPAP